MNTEFRIWKINLTISDMWVARDKSGDLYLYTNEPVRKENAFASRDIWEDYDQIDDNDVLCCDATKITWENSPIHVFPNDIKNYL